MCLGIRVSQKVVVNTPRVPGQAATQARFARILGKRFVLDNLGILSQVAAAYGALKRAAPRIRGRSANIFTQWIGDPDALGSAVLLRAILESLGATEVRILTGNLGHPQNRALVRGCGIELHNPNADRIEGALNCMVDTAPPLGMTNTLQAAPERDYLFVADHHTEGKVVEARCRESGVRRVQMGFLGLNVGSTSAFLAAVAAPLGVLDGLGAEGRAAAALGVYTDTSALLHGATPLDIRMFEKLTRDTATQRLLDDLRNYRLPPEWHGYAAPAYMCVEQVGRVRFAPVGLIPQANRDVIAEIADELLRVDQTVMAFAVALTEYGMEVSVRADSRLLEGDGERVVRVVHNMLEDAFHGVSGYKHERLPPHRVEGGAHLPHGDSREQRFLREASREPDAGRAAVEQCRACGRYLIQLLRDRKRCSPGELRRIL